jgi:flagellar protein FlaH
MATEDNFLKIQIHTDEIHGRLGIGIPRSSLMLLEGEDSSGKSAVAQRLLIGFLRNKATATYVSTELSTRDFIRQMASMDYRIDEYLLDDRLLFIPMFPRIGKTVPRKDFLDRLMSARKLFEKDCIIIDSLSSLISETYSKEEYFKLIGFFKKIIGEGKVILLTVDPEFIDKNMLTILESTCDVHFKLIMKQVGSSLKRFIMVKRFKGGSMQVGELVGFRIEPEVGFVVEISAVA